MSFISLSPSLLHTHTHTGVERGRNALKEFQATHTLLLFSFGLYQAASWKTAFHTHTHMQVQRAKERERETKPKHSHVQSVEWGTAEGVACNLNLPQAVLYLAGKLGNENCKSAACKSADVAEESPGSAEES